MSLYSMCSKAFTELTPYLLLPEVTSKIAALDELIQVPLEPSEKAQLDQVLDKIKAFLNLPEQPHLSQDDTIETLQAIQRMAVRKRMDLTVSLFDLIELKKISAELGQVFKFSTVFNFLKENKIVSEKMLQRVTEDDCRKFYQNARNLQENNQHLAFLYGRAYKRIKERNEEVLALKMDLINSLLDLTDRLAKSKILKNELIEVLEATYKFLWEDFEKEDYKKLGHDLESKSNPWLKLLGFIMLVIAATLLVQGVWLLPTIPLKGAVSLTGASFSAGIGLSFFREGETQKLARTLSEIYKAVDTNQAGATMYVPNIGREQKRVI